MNFRTQISAWVLVVLAALYWCLPALTGPASPAEYFWKALRDLQQFGLPAVYQAAPANLSPPGYLLFLKTLGGFFTLDSLAAAPAQVKILRLPLFFFHAFFAITSVRLWRKWNPTASLPAHSGLLLCLFLILNPVLLYQSIVLMDPIIIAFTFGTLAIGSSLAGKPFRAGVFHALALSIKPQAILLLPAVVLLHPREKRAWFHTGSGFLAASFLILFPFWGGSWSGLFSPYLYHLSAYLSLPLSKQQYGWYTQFAPLLTLFTLGLCIVLLRTFIFHEKKTAEQKLLLALLSALLLALFSPRLPHGVLSILLCFFSFLFLKSRILFTAFILVSLNLWIDVLDFVDATFYSSRNLTESSPYGIFSLLCKVLVASLLMYEARKSAEKNTAPFSPQFSLLGPSLSLKKRLELLATSAQQWAQGLPVPFALAKNDFLFLAGVTLAAGILNFYDLGARHAPLSVETKSQLFLLSFPPGQEIQGFWVYDGKGEGKLAAYCHGPNPSPTFYELRDFYTWKYTALPGTCTGGITLATELKEKAEVNEIFFQLRGGGKVIPERVCVEGVCDEASKWPLFDEFAFAPDAPSYRQGTYFDEIYFPRTAFEILDHEPIYESVHPPLGKVIMAAAVAVLGKNPFGWRFSGAILGLLFPALLFLFARILFGSRPASYVAALLSLWDGPRLTLSRLATPQIHTDLFSFLTFFFLFVFIRRRLLGSNSLWKDAVPLMLSGLFFGLGASTKWLTIYGLGGIFLFFILLATLEMRISLAALFKYTVVIVLGFFVLPVSVYLLSYIPYLWSGASFDSWADVLPHQKAMYQYHAYLTAKDPFSSRFFSWPFLNRPHWLYVMHSLEPTVKGTIVVLGNPAIWWAILPAMGILIYFPNFRRHPGLLFCLLAFASLYFPWIFIGRILYLYHFHPAFPFALLVIAFFWDFLWQRVRWLAVSYLMLVLALFIWFWPVFTGHEVSPQYVQSLRWFSTWIF